MRKILVIAKEMRKTFAIILAFSLMITPFAVYGQSEQTTSNSPPPVSQPLVREGDLAVKLVDALKIGTAKNEAEAETMLGSSGVIPKNGWIADYPVTPDIIGELQSAIVKAADTKRLPMGRDEALKVFGKLSADLGLPVTAETGKYAESQPPTSYEYTSPTVVNNYYYDEGPPVVTYYPPPWDYWYLYSWVPCPFFFGGFFFTGFFALHDFHRVVIFANRVVVVSNHVINPINKTVVVIDPPARTTARTFTSTSATGKTITSTSGWQKTSTTSFNSPSTRKAATSIFERSQQRLATSNTARMTGQTKPFSTGAVGQSTSSGTMGASQGQNPKTSTTQNFSGSRGSSVNTPRSSVNNPSMINGSSSSGPPIMSRSFSSPSRSFSSPQTSAGGDHGGSFSGSHSFSGSPAGRSFGGFSGGHSSGGFSGGHSFSGGFHGGGGRR